jgi:hypothetical protein
MPGHIKARRPAERHLPMTPPAGVTLETERDGLFSSIDLGESAQWRIGFHWHNLTTYELWRDGKYKSAFEFLKKEAQKHGKKVPSKTDLADWADVAAAFVEPIGIREGMDRLLRLLRYRKKFGRPGAPGDPADEPIEVPQHDGRVLQKRFGDCTEKDLKAALARSGKKKAKPKSAEAKSLSHDLSDIAATAGVAWDVSDARDGKLIVTLSGDPSHLRAALHAEEPPLDDRYRGLDAAVVPAIVLAAGMDGSPQFSATGSTEVRYSLMDVGERSFEAVFDAVKNAVKDFLSRMPPKKSPGATSPSLSSPRAG